MRQNNLKKLLLESDSEAWDNLYDTDELKKKRKQLFLSQIKNIKKFNNSVFRKQSLKEVSQKLITLAKLAEEVMLNENDDWFDKLTLKKDTKQLLDSCALFEQTSKEITSLEFRLASAYEDILHKFNKYFDIDEDNNLFETF